MTASSWTKVLKQIKKKKAKKARFLKHNKPNQITQGIGARRCRICWRYGGHIRKYGLGLCRQCFREQAKEMGFRRFG